MKYVSYILAAFAVMALAACDGNKAKGGDVSGTSFDQSRIEAEIMEEIDSIAELWNERPAVHGVFTNGKVELSVDDIKAKPDYLLPLDAATDLSLLSQKYRALGMYAVDIKVAELYKMDTGDYKVAISKIAADVDDELLAEASNDDADPKAFYEGEKELGRINLFWEASAASIIETLYVISQNTDKFIPLFDDNTVADLTYHIALLKLSLDELATYDQNIKNLSELLAPLNDLNATTVAEFKAQISALTPKIQASRQALLK